MAWVFWMIRKPRMPFFLAPVGSLSMERCTTICSCFSDVSSAAMDALVYPARLLASASLYVPSSIMVLAWDMPQVQGSDWDWAKERKGVKRE